MFEWTREPDPGWVRQLAELSPRSERVSWLHLEWFAGTPEDPVQRWVIYQMTPRARIPPLLFPLLDGPCPDPTSRDKRLWVPLLRRQWGLYRETGCYAQPYWIIQGNQGGHKRRFTRTESALCRMRGLPSYPPIAGALPYAPFDRRVIDKLAPLDRVRFWHRAHEFAERSSAELDAEEQAAVEVMRGQLWEWLETQVDRAMDEGQTWRHPLEIQTDRGVAPLDVGAAQHEVITRNL